MKVIVDVNVVVSSLLFRGVPSKVFFLNNLSNRFEFVAPEFLLIEFEKHEEELIKETKLSKEEFEYFKQFLFEEITFIPYSDFSDLLPLARAKSHNHIKDVPYIALALKLNAPIFSGDKKLKKSSVVDVLNPREMLKLLL